MSRRMPPATRNAPSEMPTTLKMSVPKSAKKTSKPKATSDARSAVRWIFSGESPAVTARKMGTTPKGSTTKKTAETATRLKETRELMGVTR